MGGRGADPPLPDQGARRDALDLPAVLRPLHAHGPGRQRRAAGDEAALPVPQKDRYQQILDYLRKTPRCATWSSRAATSPTCRSPSSSRSSSALMDIPNIRDIRLATKGLMGIPQHFLQDDVLKGLERLAKKARERGVDLAVHTHVNHAQQVTPLVAQGGRRSSWRWASATCATRACSCAASNDDAEGPARALLHAAGPREDHAVLLLHVRHDPQLRALARWRSPRRSSCSTTSWATCPGFATPRIVCDVPFVGKRWIHQMRRLRPGEGHLLLDEELPHRHRGRRSRRAVAPLRVLRPDLHPPRAGPGVVAAARVARRCALRQ